MAKQIADIIYDPSGASQVPEGLVESVVRALPLVGIGEIIDHAQGMPPGNRLNIEVDSTGGWVDMTVTALVLGTEVMFKAIHVDGEWKLAPMEVSVQF